MAANLQSSRRGITSLGKRFANQIWSGSSSTTTKLLSAASSATLSRTGRRGAHYSVYDKNVDEQVRPTVVPDEVIQPESDKYWGPHPRTGVFGPAANANANATADGGSGGSDETVGSGESVLEQKAWFRPLEDVEKPQQY